MNAVKVCRTCEQPGCAETFNRCPYDIPTEPLAPITHVALRWNGVVWSLPKPFRHHNIIRVIADLTGVKHVDCSESRGDQGFLDADGKYLNRQDALARALTLKQVLNPNDIRAGMLFSEDLW